MRTRITTSLRAAALGLAVWSVPASADIVMRGYHGVQVKVCYNFEARPGHQPVAVVNGVSGFHAYVPLTDGQCVDQGYKFNRVTLHWADSTELAKAIPDSSTDPKTVSWIDSIHCLSDAGRITSNVTQYPDSIPITDETWTYTIVGNEAAVTTIVQSYRNGTAVVASTQSIDYVWGSGSTSVHRLSTTGLALRSVRGSRVRLTIPDGTATLRVFTLSGRLLRQMRVLPTGARLGEVDLGMTPPAGSFVELRQGSRSSAIPVVDR